MRSTNNIVDEKKKKKENAQKRMQRSVVEATMVTVLHFERERQRAELTRYAHKAYLRLSCPIESSNVVSSRFAESLSLSLLQCSRNAVVFFSVYQT